MGISLQISVKFSRLFLIYNKVIKSFGMVIVCVKSMNKCKNFYGNLMSKKIIVLEFNLVFYILSSI